MTFEHAVILILFIYSVGATCFLLKAIELLGELRVELDKLKIDLLHK
jgi:hypothetical protein